MCWLTRDSGIERPAVYVEWLSSRHMVVVSDTEYLNSARTDNERSMVGPIPEHLTYLRPRERKAGQASTSSKQSIACMTRSNQSRSRVLLRKSSKRSNTIELQNTPTKLIQRGHDTTSNRIERLGDERDSTHRHLMSTPHLESS